MCSHSAARNPMMDGACITFTDLTLGYNSHPVVHHLSGAVRRGELMAVIGPNGSGKSTLIKCIAGMLRPMGGTCDRAPGTRIAYLPQLAEIDRSFPAQVVDLVSLGLWPHRGLLGRHRVQDRQAVGDAIRAVGLDRFERRAIDSLSGGQFQRALFARVLVQQADLILLDEPFNAIDSKTVCDLIGLIEGWHAEGRTVITVAHDLDLVRTNFPQALLLAREPIAWGPAGQVATSANMAKARQFQEAWDEDAPWCRPETQLRRNVCPDLPSADSQAEGRGVA